MKIPISMMLFALLAPAACGASISNASKIEIQWNQSPDFEWDGPKIHQTFKRLRESKEKTLRAIVTRETLHHSAAVRHEARELVENWMAKYSDEYISGIVQLEGARTKVTVLLHQQGSRSKVVSVSLPHIVYRVTKKMEKIGGVK